MSLYSLLSLSKCDVNDRRFLSLSHILSSSNSSVRACNIFFVICIAFDVSMIMNVFWILLFLRIYHLLNLSYIQFLSLTTPGLCIKN